MDSNWQNLSSKEIEENFNPRIAVPNFNTYIEEAQKKAEIARENLPNILNISYGDHQLQTLDIFCKNKLKKAPVHIFIHGGYWRALDKSDHSHLALPFVQNECVYFSLNYGLCPTAKLSEIKEHIISALIWVYINCGKYGGDPDNINISGHSAGAHLCAILTNYEWNKKKLPENIIKSAFLISGIYEPKVVLKLSLNEEIGLTENEATLNTPIPKSNIQSNIFLSVGDSEPSYWVDQTKSYAKELIKKNNSISFKLLKNQNHFSILNLLSDSKSRYTRRMVEVTKYE